ncbi:MAG: ERF family protein, partial [Parasporobacterium sp.]|nr:ERF family protein [Parasporobacterium sp.]
VTYGDGVDSQDKAPGKAMTYGDKYALLKAYKIITGDDPDQNYSEELKSKAEKPKPKTQKEKAKAAYPPREEMMAVILTQWDEKKILDGYGVSKLADVTDEQVMVMYAKAVAIKQQRDALDKKE